MDPKKRYTLRSRTGMLTLLQLSLPSLSPKVHNSLQKQAIEQFTMEDLPHLYEVTTVRLVIECADFALQTTQLVIHNETQNSQ